MTKRQAKREACWIASKLIDRWLECDFEDSTPWQPGDLMKIEAAMNDLSQELCNRSEKLGNHER